MVHPARFSPCDRPWKHATASCCAIAARSRALITAGCALATRAGVAIAGSFERCGRSFTLSVARPALPPPAILPRLSPWLEPQQLAGLEGLVALVAQPPVNALVLFGSRTRGAARVESEFDLAVICREPSLTPAEKTQRSWAFRQLLGSLGCSLDVLLVGAADAHCSSASNKGSQLPSASRFSSSLQRLS